MLLRIGDGAVVERGRTIRPGFLTLSSPEPSHSFAPAILPDNPVIYHSMAGTCITTIKYLGVGVLGLALSLILYQAYQTIPAQIRLVLVLAADPARLHHKITLLLILHSVAALLLSLLFYTAYKYSPLFEKHPYLVYLGVCGVAAMLGVWYGFPPPWQAAPTKTPTRAPSAAPATRSGAATTASVGDSALDKSYVHVSDEELSVILTPNSTLPLSPQLTLEAEAENIDVEVELSHARQVLVSRLERVDTGYMFAGGVSLVGFIIGAIGVLGDVLY